MSNLKIFDEWYHHGEPDICITVRYVSYLGNDLFGHQRHEYGIGYDVRIDLLEYRDFRLEKRNPRLGAYPGYIVVIATFVTVVQMCMEAFVPALYASLGLFIPLIVVNCIVLGRAELSLRRTA